MKARTWCSWADQLKKFQAKILMSILRGVALPTHSSVCWDWPKTLYQEGSQFCLPLAPPVGERMASPQSFFLRGSSAPLLALLLIKVHGFEMVAGTSHTPGAFQGGQS